MLSIVATAQAARRRGRCIEMSPRISVCTVVYNGARDIGATIDSTLGQDHPEVECIVIDGASQDGTAAIVTGYGAAIDVFVSEPDRGIYDGMNKAAARARGEFLLFMNCGDVFDGPTALSTLAGGLQGDGEQMVFGGWVRRNAQGLRSSCRPLLPRGVFNHQAVLYSRTLHDRFGPYATVRGLTAADYLFFATVLADGQVPAHVVDADVAVVDVGGISAGRQTLAQKTAIDFLCGRTGRYELAAVLALHPLYRRAKRLLGRQP